MIIQRSNLYRIEATSEQALFFEQTAGACRFVYNCALEQRRDWFRHAKLSYVQQSAELTDCRAEFDFLKAAPVHALQQALRDLDSAFQRFFAGLADYPRPRKKGLNDRFCFPDPANLDFKRLNKQMGAIKLPKIGWVKVRNWRRLPGELRNITIRKRGTHWFAAIQCRSELPDPESSKLPHVGIDRGIKIFSALSSGKDIAPLNAFKRIEGKLAKAQRKLARKVKFSSNWRKQKDKITRLHTHAANARKDFLHKQSTEIAKSHGAVKIERLRVRNMSASATGTIEHRGRNIRQKAGLNKSILDQGWSMFAGFLKYKLEQRGAQFCEVDAAYTSQTCSSCGVIDKASRKGQATFECAHCGLQINADRNAASNILQARTLAAEPPKRMLRRVGKRNQPKEYTNADS